LAFILAISSKPKILPILSEDFRLTAVLPIHPGKPRFGSPLLKITILGELR
jgi:hypothetical protein